MINELKHEELLLVNGAGQDSKDSKGGKSTKIGISGADAAFEYVTGFVAGMMSVWTDGK
ncbi:hypothetical protein [Altererythrobacter sp. ZODW24]|uniref:hypothetical protein n=1 Tax=Altererythrobacter sp. ZODW24 TaxID=2185142 RepID=UPI0013B42861|nr:hypothetical protein [Altererythrobacter sp. ZODW24]